jgi:hypothetical protein
MENEDTTLTQERQYNNLRLVSKQPTTTTSNRGTIYQDLNVKDQYIA